MSIRRKQKVVIKIKITKEQAKAMVRAYLVICLLCVPLALLGARPDYIHKPKEAKWQTCINSARGPVLPLSTVGHGTRATSQPSSQRDQQRRKTLPGGNASFSVTVPSSCISRQRIPR
jgi:hypothetical protein